MSNITDRRRDFTVERPESEYQSENYLAEQQGITVPQSKGPMEEEQEMKVLQFLEPCGDRVIVQEDPFKESSKLISTPNTAKRRPTTGTIIAVGPGVPLTPIYKVETKFDTTGVQLEPTSTSTFQVGDHVLFGNFAGTLVQFKHRPAYRILSSDEILAKITKSDEQLEAAG
jgi:co-chaperonin GroES (HSP10)